MLRLLRGEGLLRLAALRGGLGRKYGMTPNPDGSEGTWFSHTGPRPAS